MHKIDYKLFTILFVHRYFHYISHIFPTALLGSCILVSTIAIDDADCLISEASPTDNKLDDHDDACGVLSDGPSIVTSSPVASSKVVPVFRPFLLGTGYC